MTDENRTTYDNYIKLIDRAGFLKHKVYDHIITELSDLDFLEIQLGKYKAPYIKAINDNLPHFESIVNTDIEVNNYDKIEVDAILTQKQKAENLVNSILEFSKDNANIFQKTNEEFESYFKSLYDKTNNDYKGKNREFLQKKADEITKALHDAKHNYTISEFAENYIFDLEYLRTEIETEIKNSFVVKKVANTKSSSNIKHPEDNPNNFSKNGYNLFIYLYENYYLDQSATKIKLINIWHYFKNELNDKTDYQLRLTKDEYLIFINDNYKVKVKNVDKTQAYENKHLPILKGHFEAFKTLNN
ncbi:MAG: hypothetical protein KBT58_12270 [Bizionia sp.]|nr:hypothetical protein [Bizionia sp.]